MQKVSMPKKRTDHAKFKREVWDFYRKNGRAHLPWRNTRDPYKILVSEIMLQQTQVERVIPFYNKFLLRFPSTDALARAKTSEVLKLWQGLGYNRRALNLQKAAQQIVRDYGCTFPEDRESLLKLPGVGEATAGDILAFAYNKPAVVIETNIRTVFLHHFYTDQENVSDSELETLIKETLDRENPRDWYYALMDFGSFLKKSMGNNIHQSKHYKKQPPFKGSNRETRSNILKLILKKSRTEKEILELLNSPAPNIQKNLITLEKEGLIKKRGEKYTS